MIFQIQNNHNRLLRCIFICFVCTVFCQLFSQNVLAAPPVYANNSTAVAGSNVSSLTITLPSGTAEGDFLFAAISTDGNTAFNPMPGWSLLDSGQSDNNRSTLALFYKFYATSDPASFMFTWTDDQQAAGTIVRYTGVDTVNPIATFRTNKNSGKSANALGVISPAETMVIRILGTDRNVLPIGDPSGTNSRVSINSNTNSAATSLGLVDGQQGTAGSTGDATFRLNIIEQWRTVTVVLNSPLLLDFGDVPYDLSSVDAALANAYPTLLAQDGPRHEVVSNIYLGALIDSEVDGQPELNADGDDITNLADEDGVIFNPALGITAYNVILSGAQNTLDVTASVSGFLNVWIDYNQNGNFTDSGEQLFTDQPLTAGSNTLNFTTSDTAPHGDTYMRFRFTTLQNVATSPTGLAGDGEVEDYKVEVALPHTNACISSLVNGGFESPDITQFPYLTTDWKAIVESDVPGWSFQANDPAAGSSFTARNSIEFWRDGFNGVPAYEGDQFAEVNAHVAGLLYQDLVTHPGDIIYWQFAHRGRSGAETVALRIGPPGSTTEIVQATDGKSWGIHTGSYTVPAGQTVTRFEFKSLVPATGSLGNFMDSIHFTRSCDFGDAPLSYGNPAHVIDTANPVLYLGGSGGDPDPEPFTQNSDDARGDNDNIIMGTKDDENGVTFRSPAGSNHSISADVTVTNTTGNAVTVCGWLDIPSGGTVDGVFDLSDGICQSVSTSSSSVTLTWSSLPADKEYTTYARFRTCTTLADCNNPAPLPSNYAVNGEVEDYRIIFDFTPTAVTIGNVELKASRVADFLAGLNIGQMSNEELLHLLAAWSPEDAVGLSSDGRQEILSALYGYLDPDGDDQVAVFSWETLEERGTIGFFVDRRQDVQDAWTRINNDMLPGLINAPMGGEYQLVDPDVTAGTYLYRLIEQEARGAIRSYGPFEVKLE